MRAQTIQPSISLRVLKNSLNLILVPVSILTFFVFCLAVTHSKWQYADISINSLSYTIAPLFASLYLCRLAVLWQMRQTTTKKSTRKTGRRAKTARKLPYSLKPSDWIIELSALIWVAALFVFIAYLIFERVIPLGFNSFN